MRNCLRPNLNIIYPILLLLILSVGLTRSAAQNPDDLVKKDYPQLYQKYSDSIKTHPATYIFAVDFSTSMKAIGADVKDKIEEFILALPDGDRVTIVRKGTPANTGFIFFPNTPLNNSSRNSIIQTLRTTGFTDNESDGFGMTEKIIEAIRQTGGSDLIYIFMFTDFEYYTNKNGYNKNQCNWNSIKTDFDQYSKGKQIEKIGLELPVQNLKTSALYETELEDIMGGVQFYPVVDGSSLSNWFSNTRANIMRDRLKYIVEKNLPVELGKLTFNARYIGKGVVETWISGNNIFIESFSIKDSDPKISHRRPLVENPFSKTKEADATVTLSFNSNFYHNGGYNEFEKLMGKNDFDLKVTIHPPKAILSFPTALVILIVVLLLIAGICFTCCGENKLDRLKIYSISTGDNKVFHNVKRVLIGNPKSNNDIPVFDISNASNKEVELFFKTNCPLRFWIKKGLYIKVNRGNNFKYRLSGNKNDVVLMSGDIKFIANNKRFLGMQLEIDTNLVLKINK